MALREGLPIFFVRPGRHDIATGGLRPEGVQDTERARDELRAIAQRLGERSLVLASPARQTTEAAQIIGEGLGAKVIVGSDAFAWLSGLPEHISDLDRLISEQVLEQDLPTGVDAEHPISGLTVVTHGPLVGAVRNLLPGPHEGKLPPYGSVVPYTLGTWVTPNPGIRF